MLVAEGLLVPLVLLFPQEGADLLGDLESAVKRKDPDAVVQTIDRLAQQAKDFDARQREKAARALGAVIKARKDDGDDVERMFVAAAAGLSVLADEGEEMILDLLPLTQVERRPTVVATLVEALGQQANPARIPALLKALDRGGRRLRSEACVVAAAARALRFYGRAPVDARKQAAGKLVALYGDLEREFYAAREREDAEAEEVMAGFQVVEPPILGALQTLTGAVHGNAADWRRWWDENKDADWGQGSGGPGSFDPPRPGAREDRDDER